MGRSQLAEVFISFMQPTPSSSGNPGPWLLGLVAIGLTIYGLNYIAQARYRQISITSAMTAIERLP
jgi:hypothetical protein